MKIIRSRINPGAASKQSIHKYIAQSYDILITFGKNSNVLSVHRRVERELVEGVEVSKVGHDANFSILVDIGTIASHDKISFMPVCRCASLDHYKSDAKHGSQIQVPVVLSARNA